MPEWYVDTSNNTSTIRIDPPEPSTAWTVNVMPDTRVEEQVEQVMETPLNEACMTTDATDDHIVYYSMDEFNYVMADTPEVHRTVKRLLEEAEWIL
jgi:hypothetical protein